MAGGGSVTSAVESVTVGATVDVILEFAYTETVGP